MFPVAFSDLEPFSGWALPQESDRNKHRMDSSYEEMRAMHTAVMARLDDITDALDAKPSTKWDEPEVRLLCLSLSLVEVGIAMERYKDPMVFTRYDLQRVVAKETSRFRPQVPLLGYVPPPWDFREPIPMGTDLAD